MLRVRVILTGLQGAPWVATHYFANDELQADADAAVAAVGAFWGAVDSRIVNTIDWTTESEVAVLTPSGARTGSFAVTPATGTGGASGNPVARATQAVIQWRTGFFAGGREIRGRTFVPGLQDSDITNEGQVASGARTALAAAATTMATDASNDLVVWSRTNAAVATVSSATCWQEFGVLRSRRD